MQNVRYNFIVNTLDGAFFGLAALGLASYVTIVPLFMETLTDSTTLIGLVVTVHMIGWQLPQLLTSGIASRLSRYLPLVLRLTLIERLPYLGLVFLALFIPQIDNTLALIIAIVLFCTQSFGGGFTATVWQSMLGKILPSRIHGTFFGTQSAAANLTGGMGAVLAGVLLATLPYPLNFAVCFGLAFIAIMISFGFLAATREAEHEPLDTDGRNQRVFWRKLRQILREDPNFRWFLAARVLTQFAQMAVAFYIIYASRVYDLQPETAGILTGVFMLAKTIASPIFGWLGDRFGHRRVMALGNVLMALSATMALFAPDISWFYIIFALTGVVETVIWTGVIAMTVEFGTVKSRPYYIGLSNTLTSPATIIAPILGGWLADTAGFQATFTVSIVAGLAGAVLLLFFLQDPRKLKRSTGD